MDRANAFENLLNIDTELALFVLVAWLWTAVAASRAAYARTVRRLRRRAWRLLVALGLAAVTIAARAVAIVAMAGYGWDFAADRVLVALPLVVVPAAAAARLTVPRVWRLAHLADPDDATGAVPGPVRAAAFAPHLAVPVQAAACGAAAGLYMAFVAPIDPPIAGPALLVILAWALASGVLWAWRAGRARVAGPVRRRMGTRALRAAAVAVAVVAVTAGCAALSYRSSVLPGRMPMSADGHQMAMAAGPGNAPGGSASAHGPSVDVTSLTGHDTGKPDRRYTLVAEQRRVRLASGRTFEGWTFNGRVPGPTLRARVGDLVQVTLVNHLPKANVTLHWHGVDVPNAMDGVPGVTQNAVKPGGRFVYRFRVGPGDAGTHWYHSHQQSAEQVRRGLFGPLIIEPRTPQPRADEVIVDLHTWPGPGLGIRAIGTDDLLERRTIAPGRRVRLRVIDSAPTPRFLTLDGAPFTVAAVDGNPVNAPTPLTGARLTLGSGGRYDLEFTMPDGPVHVSETLAPRAGLLISPPGAANAALPSPAAHPRDLDLTRYGSPAPAPIGPHTRFDKTFTYMFDNKPGFYNGAFTFLWTINGQVFPNVPPLVVHEGDLVKVRFINRSHLDHPMHLHGHDVYVLSKDGRPVTGSPLPLDTVDVQQGEIWEIGFRADNPGVWMDHCHNFDHAALGMVMHLMYDNVRSPFLTGRRTPNEPN